MAFAGEKTDSGSALGQREGLILHLYKHDNMLAANCIYATLKQVLFWLCHSNLGAAAVLIAIHSR